MRLKHRMGIIPIVATVSLLAIVVLTRFAGREADRLTRDIEEGYVPALEGLHDLTECTQNAQRAFEDAVSASDADQLAVADDEAETFRRTLEEMKGLPAVDAALTVEVGGLFGRYSELGRATASAMIAGRFQDIGAETMKDLTDTRSSLRELLDRGRADMEAELAAAFEGIRASQRQSNRVFAGIGLLTVASILVIGSLSIMVIRSVTGSVQAVVTVAESLRSRDLTQRVRIRGRDEIGTMADSMNEALGQLEDALRSISRSADQIGASSGTLDQDSESIRTSIVSVSNDTASVAKNSADLASAVQMAAAGMEEMTASVGEIAASAASAADLAMRVAGMAEETNRTMGDLHEQSGAIQEIIQMILQIANQTHLLALNATIEAERAGESGRGFRVVAKEVKHLAEETARATVSITDRVRTMRERTETAVDSVAGINEEIRRIRETQTTIAGAVEEQRAVAAEILQNVVGAATESSAIDRRVGEVAESTSRVSDSADSNRESARQLREVAEELRAITGAFRYGDKSARAEEAVAAG